MTSPSTPWILDSRRSRKHPGVDAVSINFVSLFHPRRVATASTPNPTAAGKGDTWANEPAHSPQLPQARIRAQGVRQALRTVIPDVAPAEAAPVEQRRSGKLWSTPGLGHIRGPSAPRRAEPVSVTHDPPRQFPRKQRTARGMSANHSRTRKYHAHCRPLQAGGDATSCRAENRGGVRRPHAFAWTPPPPTGRHGGTKPRSCDAGAEKRTLAPSPNERHARV